MGDPLKAMNTLKQVAEQGHPDAQLMLGLMLAGKHKASEINDAKPTHFPVFAASKAMLPSKVSPMELSHASGTEQPLQRTSVIEQYKPAKEKRRSDSPRIN